MTSINGISEPAPLAGGSTGQDTANALLTVDLSARYDAPPLAPGFDDGWPEPEFMPAPKPQRDYATATWLDAVAAITDRPAAPATTAVAQRIASINSDDNGLYRMFIGVSP